MFANYAVNYAKTARPTSKPRAGQMRGAKRAGRRTHVLSWARKAEAPDAAAASVDPYAAVGVMTIPQHTERRSSARQTWMTAANIGATVAVRFLIRAVGLSPDAQAQMQQEQAAHRDVLMLPVASSKRHPPKGRVLSLHSWFKQASVLFPKATWICKADDDVYIVAVDWEAQLRLIAAGKPDRAIVHGKVVWHNWNVEQFMPHSFDFSYNPSNWRRVIDYLAGDASKAHGADERHRFEVCRKRGAQACEWCPTERECTGPFPFVTGWLMTLSAPLARALATSEAVEAEVGRATRLDRSWGPPILEDVWLGSAVHRLLPTTPVTWVQMDFAHQFNGDWPSVYAQRAARTFEHSEIRDRRGAGGWVCCSRAWRRAASAQVQGGEDGAQLRLRVQHDHRLPQQALAPRARARHEGGRRARGAAAGAQVRPVGAPPVPGRADRQL